MMKKMIAMAICLVMVIAMVPTVAINGLIESVSAASIVMPSDNGKTNGGSYVLGAGTDAEVTVYRDWRSTSMKPTGTFTPKYIMIHNTGTYVSTATAKNVHTNTNKTSTGAAWHYTVDDKAIYQGLADNRKGWHAATSYSNYPSNVNAIGIETCVNSFPATETFGGEQWTNGTAIMQWWENQFDQTMKHAAYLSLVLCERWGLNWKTAIVMHWNAFQYDTASKKGKDCPMQMRATYNPDTNKFSSAGYYKDGRDGYFWQMFWSYLEQYASGAKIADNPLENRHTITFETNGGTAVDPVRVKNGETFSAPAAPSKYAFNFAGWYCNPELTDPYDFNTPVPYDFTLYAKWDEAYWGANNNLMPNAQQLQLNSFNDQGAIWPYWNTDEYGSVTMYNGVTNDDNWSWPSAYMGYENSFDSVNNNYLYVKKDGTASFNVIITYLDKDGTARDLYLSDVANLDGTDFPAGPLENFYNVGSYIRNLGHAPASGNVKFTRVTYFVIGPKDSYVKLYDMKFTEKFAIADPHKTLMNSNISQLSGVGNYSYSNGTLTMTASGADGYSVKMNVGQTIDPSKFGNLLIDVNSSVDFNISMDLTNGYGPSSMSFRNEFFNNFDLEAVPSSLPAGEWIRCMNLRGYYEWNGGLIGESTISTITITLKGPGTLTLKALQASQIDTINYVQDNGYSSGKLTAPEDDDSGERQLGDVNGDGAITTMDARMAMLEALKGGTMTAEEYAAADYNGDGEVTTIDARLMMLKALTT